MTAKCYYCKIWRNGDLLFDLVPAVSKPVGVGMFDKIGKAFYSS